MIDAERLLGRLDDLAAIGRGDGPGVTRLAWSAEERAAVASVTAWAAAAGAVVWADAVGNLIAERPGGDPGLPPLVTGSHLDTVVEAGVLDGAYGVVAGIEVLASLAAAGTTLRHPLRVVAYANEEGVVAPPFTGSRAIAGHLDPTELDWSGPDGLSLADRLRRAGGDPDRVDAAAWVGPVAATVELHIEQGPVLATAGLDIGVVTAITAQSWGRITVTGQANHAGTTPMNGRRDALIAGARLVLAVRDLTDGRGAEVATVGRLTAQPGVTNVIPGRVELSFDVRSIDDDDCAGAMAALDDVAATIAAETGTEIAVERLSLTAAARTDGHLRRVIGERAAGAGLAAIEMPSGAGHDCAHLARLGPIGMIFVPSTGGVSHSHHEETPPQSLVRGAGVLLETLVSLDDELEP